MTFTCLYFLPKVMVKISRKVWGHFVTLTEVAMHLTECNPVYNSTLFHASF